MFIFSRDERTDAIQRATSWKCGIMQETCWGNQGLCASTSSSRDPSLLHQHACRAGALAARLRPAAEGHPGTWHGLFCLGCVALINRFIPGSYCKHFSSIKAPVSGLCQKSRCFVGSGKHQRRIKADALILSRPCAGWIKRTFQILF